eukprot:12560319-Alexandrium_andersonii.AAC.1
MRVAWEGVYEGNCDTVQGACRFMQTYGQHIKRSEQADLRPITGRQLKAAVRALRPTSAGCDGWAPSELRDMPEPALRWLVRFFNALEEGQICWPRAVLLARLVFLGKTPAVTFDPLKFRGLLICSALY